ncbi:TPA: hypothetical protein ACJGX6_005753, partial [Salmonella enterica subsp. enterica serovar Paratyphi B]
MTNKNITPVPNIISIVLLMNPPKKEGRRITPPSKISTKIILTISVQGRCTDISTVFSYSADAGQARKM